MSAELAILYVALFWAIIHAVRIYLSKRNLNRQLLPTSHGTLTTTTASFRCHLRLCYLRIESFALRRTQDNLITFLNHRREHSHLKARLKLFYDIGTVLSILGMVIAVGLLGATALQQVQLLFASNNPSTIVKRSISSRREEQSVTSSSYASFYLLLPGVTVPLWHLLPLLFALFFSQLIHEAGHGLAAAAEGIPLLSVGASVIAVIPSAFVSLPQAAVEALPSRSQLRIIGAGPFHNVILWLILWLLAHIGVGNLLWSMMGYRNTIHFGRVISHVDMDSSLDGHLPVGAVITKLNDHLLTSADDTQDLWTSYLSRQQPTNSLSTDEHGWCVNRDWYKDQDRSCCTTNSSSTENQSHPGLSCFILHGTPISTESIDRCVSPLNLLSIRNQLSLKRCDIPMDCTDHEVCITPRGDQELTRITLWIPRYLHSYGSSPELLPKDLGGEEKVVLWSGSGDEILEEVEVTTYLPRYRFLPIGLPHWFDVLTTYLTTLTLSLYLFNLLPLPYLDGEQFLIALLNLLLVAKLSSSEDALDLGDLEGGLNASADDGGSIGREKERWKMRIIKAMKGFVGWLIGIWFVCGIWNALRR
ncbi:hypothetical protein C8Q75DRAFT_803692 [Abortiporus biennis]|nr:hypothetical protein C8Q75DRAFT_803692 [Abortiporus biennis]